MFEEKQFSDVTKEMRTIITPEEVYEFISMAREEECKYDQHALDLENAMRSVYLDRDTKIKMEEAAKKERAMACKWNALWAVFDHAEFYRVKK